MRNLSLESVALHLLWMLSFMPEGYWNKKFCIRRSPSLCNVFVCPGLIVSKSLHTFVWKNVISEVDLLDVNFSSVSFSFDGLLMHCLCEPLPRWVL